MDTSSNDEMRRAVARRIRVLLAEHGPQSEVARRIGVAQSFVSTVVRGQSLPSITMLIGLRREYGASIDWILMGDGAAVGEAAAESVHAEVYRQLDAVLDAGGDLVAAQVLGYLDGLAARRPAPRAVARPA